MSEVTVRETNESETNESVTWTVGGNAFTWYGRGNTGVTRFADGLTLTAAPNGDPDSRARAFLLGYGQGADELARMCREHELLHTWLAARQGLAHSPALRAALCDGDLPAVAPLDERHAEEAHVMDLQARLNRTTEDGDLVRAARAFLGSGVAAPEGVAS